MPFRRRRNARAIKTNTRDVAVPLCACLNSHHSKTGCRSTSGGYLRSLLELTYKWDLALLSHYSWRVAAVREKRRSYASWLLVQEVFACASAIVSHVLAVPKLTPKNAFRLRKPSVLTDCLRRFDL